MVLKQRKYIIAAVAVVLWFFGGCNNQKSEDIDPTGQDIESIQKLVKDKMVEHQQPKAGSQRWQEFKVNVYQSSEDIDYGRESINGERSRKDRARLMRARPMGLTDCVVSALEFNDRIAAKRAAIQVVGGDELIIHSRFLPRVFIDLSQEISASSAGAMGIQYLFRLTQTLLEFGKDNPQDVILREQQRTALFEYEDIVSEVLSDVRVKLFTILLRKQQLAQRKVLLSEFLNQYEKIQKRFDKKQVVEVDVLTARLNMLNEKTRINSLEKEILRQKIDLLYLSGFPVEMTDVKLEGQLETFELDINKAVAIALQRNTGIAQSRADAAEQYRRLMQVGWSFAPETDIKAGWRDGKNSIGAELINEDGTFKLNPSAEHHIKDGELIEGFLAQQNRDGLFWGLDVEIPLYLGDEIEGQTIKELGLFIKAQHELRDTIDVVEINVRKDYQIMLERREELEILAETVAISKKRLNTKERLKELDRITDDELETFRDRFFRDQDAYFTQQIAYIEAQEQLRLTMRYFELLESKED